MHVGSDKVRLLLSRILISVFVELMKNGFTFNFALADQPWGGTWLSQFFDQE
jgi:hypothetical protein